MIVSSEYVLLEPLADDRRYVVEKFYTDTGEEYELIYLAEPGQDYQEHLDASRLSISESLAQEEAYSILNG
jgi:hypothetical protein